MPYVIRLAHRRGLVDHPQDRSSHTRATPSLGGIPIFFATVIPALLFSPGGEFVYLPFVFLALFLVFVLGALDDVRTLSARAKLPGQIIVAAVLVLGAEVRLESMYGLLGFQSDFPWLLSVFISMFTILVIMNAFNLIDGINGLAASLGCLINICLGCWFYLNDLPVLGLLALSLAGALLAFLRFNVTPARIFMGDTGSLLIGTLTAMLVIRFIDLCARDYTTGGSFCFNNPVAVAIALLIVPLFDTLRVFITRMLRGKSPFTADRRHIHHLLIDCGLSHMAATSILMLVNMSFICMAFMLDASWGLHRLLTLEIGIALSLTYILHRMVYQKGGRGRLVEQKLSGKSS